MQSKADLAYDFIKGKIISGELAPLSPICEADLQKEIGASRTPVREAILRLRDSGFIYIFPNNATLVSEISLDLINEIYDTRFANEPFVNIEASKRVPSQYLEDLKEKIRLKDFNHSVHAQRVYKYRSQYCFFRVQIVRRKPF